MSFAPKISVVVVNFNAGSGLIDCVRSVAAQADELIVIDNASSDGSMDGVREAASILPDKIVVMLNTDNLGFARACNMGIGASAHDAVLLLNPDCVLEQGALDVMREALRTYPEAGMFGGLLLNPDGSEQAGGRRLVPTPWRSFVRAFGLGRLESRYPRLFEGYDLHKAPLPRSPQSVEAISGACMLVRKEVIDDVGMLDEHYFMHCEDLDWCMRFRQKGWQIVFLPDARMTHFKGVCSRSRPVFVEWHKHKGMIRFYRKFFRHQYPGAVMWLVALGVWIRFACLFMFASLRSTRMAMHRLIRGA